MRKLAFKSWYNGNSGTVSARRMLRLYNEENGHHWADRPHKRVWDHSGDLTDNHKQAVREAARISLQKDPVSISWAGEDTDGILWMVEVTE